MRLRLRRSQHISGVISSKTVFRLEARVDVSAEEEEHIRRYKMGREILYSKQRVELATSAETTTWKGIARNVAAIATALTIRIDDLISGTAVECKDIVEMLTVEEQIVAACQTFKAILQSAAYFDGEEVVEL